MPSPLGSGSILNIVRQISFLPSAIGTQHQSESCKKQIFLFTTGYDDHCIPDVRTTIEELRISSFISCSRKQLRKVLVVLPLHVYPLHPLRASGVDAQVWTTFYCSAVPD